MERRTGNGISEMEEEGSRREGREKGLMRRKRRGLERRTGKGISEKEGHRDRKEDRKRGYFLHEATFTVFTKESIGDFFCQGLPRNEPAVSGFRQAFFWV
jgi:hypothetical protein